MLISALLLSSCGEGGNTISNTKPGSEPTNSSQIILSPYDLGLEESDESQVIDYIDETLTYIEFPKIPINQLLSATIKSDFRINPPEYKQITVIDDLIKENAELLAKFVNCLKPKMTKYTKEFFYGLVGSAESMEVSFNLDDGSKLEFFCFGGYCKMNDRYYTFNDTQLKNFIRFILGIDLFNEQRTKNGVVPTKDIEPELISGLAHNTVVGENSSENSSVFQKIARENLSKVTVLTRANAPNPTRIVLTDEQTQKLFKHGIDKIEFVPANLTKDDFSYDYGDYFRIIFDYADGSQVQIAYDGFYHSSLTNGYFRSKNGDLGVILNEVLQIKIYPYE